MRTRPNLYLPMLAGVLVIALAVAVVVAASSGGGATSSQGSAESSGAESLQTDTGFDGAALPGVSAPGFTLTDQYGRPVSLSEFRGRVTVLTFLYSRCGATCILIAQQIRGALDELPHPVPVVIVSADPSTDTPASVARFLSEVSLDGRAEYLSGPLPQLRAVWRAYRVTPASTSRATFDRFAFLLLLDARGRERVLFEPEVLTPEALAHDIGKLQAG